MPKKLQRNANHGNDLAKIKWMADEGIRPPCYESPGLRYDAD